MQKCESSWISACIITISKITMRVRAIHCSYRFQKIYQANIYTVKVIYPDIVIYSCFGTLNMLPQFVRVQQVMDIQSYLLLV